VIRSADPTRDGAACAEIYAGFVTGGPTSFEEVAPTSQEMTARLEEYGASHACLVAERDGEVIGYAYGAPHRVRPAYRWACDVSVYVTPEAHRSGTGRALYTELFERLRARGFRVAVAGITIPNDASVGLHESLGFEQAGVYRKIGWKAGAWRDVGFWQLQLAAQGESDGQPAKPA